MMGAAELQRKINLSLKKAKKRKYATVSSPYDYSDYNCLDEPDEPGIFIDESKDDVVLKFR